MKPIDNQYLGCNLCKRKEVPTEKFDGYCGNILWFCDACTKKLKQPQRA